MNINFYTIVLLFLTYLPLLFRFSLKRANKYSIIVFIVFFTLTCVGYIFHIKSLDNESIVINKMNYIFKVITKAHIISLIICFVLGVVSVLYAKANASTFNKLILVISSLLILIYAFFYFFVYKGGRFFLIIFSVLIY